MKRILLAIFILSFIAACNNPSNPGSGGGTNPNTNPNPAPPMLSYNIVAVYPHDTSSYTEGLIWYNSMLYESGGLKGKSKLYTSDLTNGKDKKVVTLDPKYFGEGISIIDNKIYQLTWQENKVFIYDANTLQKIGENTWPYEGWGMTTNGKELIISTGSSNLYFVDPATFKINKIVSVVDNYGPVGNVNELEYVNGFIYSNVYGTDYILKINAETGNVVGKMDLTGLLDKSNMPHNPADYPGDNGNVLNGIAYNAEKNSFYITGKDWPALFEIKLN